MNDFINKILCGNALPVLKGMPAESVDMCLTSPPYWALRNYQTEGVIWDGDINCRHEWQDSPIEHDNLRFRGESSDVRNNKNENIFSGKTDSSGGFCRKCKAWCGSLGLEPTVDLYIKHLCDIFDEVKRVLKKGGTCWVNLGDTYGTQSGAMRDGKFGPKNTNTQPFIQPKNVHKCLIQIPTRFSTEMCNRFWILRNDIIWKKDNCMPSSVDDRFTVDYEHLFFFSKNPKYYFEQQFEKAKMNRWGGNKFELKPGYEYKNQAAIRIRDDMDMMPEKRNKRSVWTINTKPNPESHFATFPEKLLETPIRAGCPEGGVVLDTFAGISTTAKVASKLNRKYIMIELSELYCKKSKRLLSQKYFEL